MMAACEIFSGESDVFPNKPEQSGDTPAPAINPETAGKVADIMPERQPSSAAFREFRMQRRYRSCISCPR
jgi:hypothetical protein